MRRTKERLSDKSLVKAFSRLVIRESRKLMYQKMEDGKYKIYCTNCQKYKRISANNMKTIRTTHICPDCYHDVTPTRSSFHKIEFVELNLNGYMINVDVEIGKKPKCFVIEVAHFNGGPNVECRYIQRPMMLPNCVFEFHHEQDKWRTRKNLHDEYWNRFIHLYDGDIENLLMKDPVFFKSNRKEYLTEVFGKLELKPSDIKSNQLKLFQSNVFNAKQIIFALAFDLKTPEEVYKYNGYYNKQLATNELWKYQWLEPYRVLNNIYTTKPLNVFYLDYLHRNKIDLIDYEDYMTECRELGFKLDKPKDFWARHLILDEMYENKKNAKTNKSITKQYQKLEKNRYEKDNLAIIPFKSYGEMVKCGKKLHNCIGRLYTDRYARGEVDLYHLDIDGDIVAAIEIKNGKLVQARIDNNKECPAEYKKAIKNMIRAKYKTKEGAKLNA